MDLLHLENLCTDTVLTFFLAPRSPDSQARGHATIVSQHRHTLSQFRLISQPRTITPNNVHLELSTAISIKLYSQAKKVRQQRQKWPSNGQTQLRPNQSQRDHHPPSLLQHTQSMISSSSSAWQPTGPIPASTFVKSSMSGTGFNNASTSTFAERSILSSLSKPSSCARMNTSGSLSSSQE